MCRKWSEGEEEEEEEEKFIIDDIFILDNILSSLEESCISLEEESEDSEDDDELERLLNYEINFFCGRSENDRGSEYKYRKWVFGLLDDFDYGIYGLLMRNWFVLVFVIDIYGCNRGFFWIVLDYDFLYMNDECVCFGIGGRRIDYCLGWLVIGYFLFLFDKMMEREFELDVLYV